MRTPRPVDVNSTQASFGMAGDTSRDIVGGLENGLSVIEAFSEGRQRMSITEISEVTGLTRAASRRYLLTLVHLGYAEHDGKFFSLTPRVLGLGYAYLSSITLPARIQPFLERVSEVLSESSSAAVLDDQDVVYLARSATRRIMSIGLSVGSRLPAYCTSLGRALLAHQEPEWLDRYFARVELRPLTTKTLTGEADIRDALSKVRELGYCLVDEELEIGLRSLAMPVMNAQGRIACAINVGVQASRVSVRDMLERVRPVLATARDELRRVL
jgi:IclR family pca regulon transcriptional regulator